MKKSIKTVIGLLFIISVLAVVLFSQQDLTSNYTSNNIADNSAYIEASNTADDAANNTVNSTYDAEFDDVDKKETHTQTDNQADAEIRVYEDIEDNEIKSLNEDEKTDLAKSDKESRQEEDTEDGIFTCSLSVRCDTILENMELLKQEKSSIIPESGVIYKAENVVFYEGESAFNVLSRELKQNKIHFEFNVTPVYNTAYIEGIANIYEFDCGELSGWLYKVNNIFPSVGCSQYILENGDDIEFMFTCNMGKDVGNNYN